MSTMDVTVGVFVRGSKGRCQSESNVIADDLSRWSFTSDIPHGFAAESRVRFTLRDLWEPCLKCTKYPSDAHLLWELPLPI
jgi:hypothetical protein